MPVTSSPQMLDEVEAVLPIDGSPIDARTAHELLGMWSRLGVRNALRDLAACDRAMSTLVPCAQNRLTRFYRRPEAQA